MDPRKKTTLPAEGTITSVCGRSSATPVSAQDSIHVELSSGEVKVRVEPKARPSRDMAWARRYVWSAMAETLRSDIEGSGPSYLYDETHDAFDHRRVMTAAEQILAFMRKKATRKTG
jgi:hypothetical protein